MTRGPELQRPRRAYSHAEPKSRDDLPHHERAHTMPLSVPRSIRSTAFGVKTNVDKAWMWARGYGSLAQHHDDGATRNIYFATVQRSGSQWLKSIFADDRMRRITGLEVYPQHRYEWNEFRERFPPYTFVPGLYMSYDLYQEIIRPEPYRTIYVLRDPRDIAVSWYWSTRDTHMEMGKVSTYRRDLQQLNFEDGLAYSIRALAGKFTDIRTWMYHQDDPHVLLTRFEDLTASPDEELQRVLSHCRLQVPDDLRAQILSNYTRERMRRRDLAGRSEGAESHYRATSSDHRVAFTTRHHELFEEVTGNLIELTGYGSS